MDKYIVIRDWSLQRLAIKVNEQMQNNGYKPIGGIAVNLTKSSDEIFYQAMVQD